jgi:hypothetical protein
LKRRALAAARGEETNSILKVNDVVVWSGLIWLRIVSSFSPLGTPNEFSRTIKGGEY